MKLFFKATLLLVIFSTSVQAQLVKFGFKAGANYANQSGTSLTINSVNYNSTEAITSYHLGFVAEIKPTDKFAIQPELLYSTQGATYKNLIGDFKNELGYLSIPLLCKFYLGKSNIISIDLGPQASFLLAEKNDFNYNDSSTFEFSALGGLGINVTKHFFVQARYGLGITDAFNTNRAIKNSVAQVSAGFYF
jgi:hypothetical protein